MSKLLVIKSILLALSVLLVTFCNNSYADKQPHIEFNQFWVALPPAVARSTAGYGIIKNTGNAADILIDIRSNAGSVMLHQTDVTSGMARMVHMPYMIIEANSELVLEPMSFHLMFSDLCPITFIEGGMVTLSFEFEKSGVKDIEVPLQSAWQ